MGDAKRRARAYEAAVSELLEGLNGDGLKVAETAIALFERFIRPKRFTGGCYLTTMILHKYLSTEHGIPTQPVVGYVNDGTDDIMISHAWLEFEGRKTDLTLQFTDRPDVQLQGALLVLDVPLLPGRADYTYHHDRSAESLAQLAQLRDDPSYAPILDRKEQEHIQMSAVAKSETLIEAYIAGAPTDQGYDAMTAVLR